MDRAPTAHLSRPDRVSSGILLDGLKPLKIKNLPTFNQWNFPPMVSFTISNKKLQTYPLPWLQNHCKDYFRNVILNNERTKIDVCKIWKGKYLITYLLHSERRSNEVEISLTNRQWNSYQSKNCPKLTSGKSKMVTISYPYFLFLEYLIFSKMHYS